MSLRKLWLISIADRSVIYLKSFPIVEIQARHLGLPFLPAFRGHREEVEFIHSLFKGLGIDSFAALLQTHNRSSRSSRSSSLSSDTLSLDGVDFNESPDLDFDCSLSNQLPVVEMTFKDMKIWPVIVVEHGGILFCGLPLTEGPSRELIDHMSISMAFAALQAIIKQFTRENRVTCLEEYISGVMPFGTFVSESMGCVPPIKPANLKRGEDAVVEIKVSELISSGLKGKELVYGTVTVQNKLISSPKGFLVVTLKNLDELNVILSPHCTKVDASRVQIKLSDSKLIKYFHYKIDPPKEEIQAAPLISYNYKITRSQQQRHAYKVELTLHLRNPSQCKFSFFNVQFKQAFADGSARVISSNVNWGQMHLEKAAGLFWIIGSKFPKSGQVQLSCDVIAGDDIEFSDALCNFRGDNLSIGMRLTKDIIAVNEHVTPSPKLFVDHTLTSFDYKLQPTFE